MNRALKLYNQLEKYPLGKRLFSKLISIKAPYFGTIRPMVLEMRPNFGRIRMKKRRAVTNHIGTVHAIAMANLCELAGGMILDVSLPGNLRWIPSGMDINYLALAKTDLEAVCSIPEVDFASKKDIAVEVSVFDTGGREVVHASIRMHISPKK